MRKLSPCCCASLLLVSVAAQAASDGLDRITVYAGTWHTQAEHYATPYSKAGKETGTLHNDCWRGRAFYACEQIVDGQSKALIVFQRGKDGDHYVTHALPADDVGTGNAGAVRRERNRQHETTPCGVNRVESIRRRLRVWSSSGTTP